MLICIEKGGKHLCVLEPIGIYIGMQRGLTYRLFYTPTKVVLSFVGRFVKNNIEYINDLFMPFISLIIPAAPASDYCEKNV